VIHTWFVAERHARISLFLVSVEKHKVDRSCLAQAFGNLRHGERAKRSYLRMVCFFIYEVRHDGSRTELIVLFWVQPISRII